MTDFPNPPGGSQGRGVPDWLARILSAGYRPYVATAEHMLPQMNLQPFGQPVERFLLDDPNHHAFHDAYLLSNSLGFKSRDLKMPNWVLIDCVYMQTAVVGFAKAVADLPDAFLDIYRTDGVDVGKLDFLPVTGQIASPTLGGMGLIGISLFSLREQIGDRTTRDIGVATKALAMEVYRAREYEWFYGISQYDNRALRTIHGRLGSRMEIHRPVIPLHPKSDMTLIYRMRLDVDPYKLSVKPAPGKVTFWMKADDRAIKRRMEEGIKANKSYAIVPPFHEDRPDGQYLPILEEDVKS